MIKTASIWVSSQTAWIETLTYYHAESALLAIVILLCRQWMLEFWPFIWDSYGCPNINSNIFVFVFDCLQNWDRYQNCEKQENYFDKKIQKTHATEHFGK